MRKNLAKGTKVNVNGELATVIKAYVYKPIVIVMLNKTNREIAVPMDKLTYAR